MTRINTLLGLFSVTLSVGLIAAACTGSGLETPRLGDDPGANEDQGLVADSQGTASDVSPIGGEPVTGQDATTPDTSSPQDTQSDPDSGALTDTTELTDSVSPEDDATGGPCPGCFGAPCEESLDCNSGWCVQGDDGLMCTKTCSADCPAGFSCQQVTQSSGDPVFLCLYDHVHYCRPCAESADCAPPLMENSQARCVELWPSLGHFCVTPCAVDSDCPSDAACSPLADDPETMACQPITDTCSCSDLSVESQAKTDCYVTNAHGTCDGERMCSEEGLTDCSAMDPAPETCNGVDDDCDGTIDEAMVDVGLPCDGDDPDLCQDGTVICEDGVPVCVDPPGLVETCNGVDDDCDESIDEDVAEVGSACDGSDADECSDGTLTCANGELACIDGTEEHPEVCNGEDDDCDGKVDEDFADLGTPCDGPDSDECEEGNWICGDGMLSCSDTSDDNVEVCDNGDDDCDGAIDENFALKGTVCDGEDGDFCSDGMWICDGIALICNDDPATLPELCNDSDDDCDGMIDEGYEGKFESCDGNDPDDCEDGQFVCGPSGLNVECNDDDETGAELCNEADDDCDGLIDESFLLKGETCDGGDADSCSDGVWTCDGVALVCNDAPESVSELCGGGDEDCDGEVDEGFEMLGTPCDGADADACTDGTFICDNGTVVCQDDPASVEEVCNTQDDDCDGATDEAFPLLGTPCDGEDVDDCADGQWVCNGTVPVCNDDGTSGVELCNGVDDNCDGATDEGIAPEPCSVSNDAGTCDGIQTCTDGALVCDAAQPMVEICNNVDDNCDGAIDNAVPTETCTADSAFGSCAGTATCDGAGQMVCDAVTPLMEICNNVDDNCDGETDNGVATEGCANTNAFGTCTGTATCDGAGQMVCDAAVPLEEICNGADDNCDGVADDGWDLLGEPCDGDDDDKCSDGTTVCAEDGGYGCTDDAASTAELCDGADNDCDGSLDEAFPTLGDACDGDDADECADGVVVCDGDTAVRCTDDAASTAEECNGVDDNCDGVIDEGCCGAIGEVCCTTGEVCQAPFTCDAGTCACEPKASEGCVDGDAWWLDCHGEPSSLKEGCGSCGCVGGTCNTVDPPICIPDQEDVETQDIACGLCGTQTQTRTRNCTQGCDWPEWGPWQNTGACTDQGVCAPDAVDGDTQTIPCGNCGEQSQSRERSCTDTCQWAAWPEWQNEGECLNSGVCAAGEMDSETQVVDCGFCGTKTQKRTRMCADGCGWAAWGEWVDEGVCQNPGICEPGSGESQTQDIGCGNCGTQSQKRDRSCNSACGWGEYGGWYDVGACGGSGECSPDALDSETRFVDCGNCGTKQQQRDRTCTGTCGWGAFGDWYDVGGCIGSGVCSPGDGDSESQEVGCGFCGSQSQTRDRTCTDSCQWGSYGSWYDVDGCDGSGSCNPGTENSETQTIGCGACGSQLQQRDQQCNASCGWGAYGDWYNVGGCSDSGVCTPGASESETRTVACGNCGSQAQQRDRTCTAGCGWGAFGGWYNIGSCSGQGSCSPGSVNSETQGVGCGLCGSKSQQRDQTCNASCGWDGFGGWYDTTTCGGQGSCTPGQVNTESQSVGCGNCGSKTQQRSQTCNGSCGWGGFSGWSDVTSCGGQGSCSPGATNSETQSVGCGNCGSKTQQRDQTCNGSCGWGSFGGWYDTGGCGGEGSCAVGAVDVESQMLPCGNCGFQAQTRQRTCSGSCGWGSFSGWSNVGSCSESGECSPGAVETQTQEAPCTSACGSGFEQQSRNRTCSGSCGWGGWSAWLSIKGCNGPGQICTPGEFEEGMNPDCPPFSQLNIGVCSNDGCSWEPEYCEDGCLFCK